MKTGVVICLLSALAACTTGSREISAAEFDKAIRGAIADVGCSLSGATAKEAERPFEIALAKRLDVPLAQVSDRDSAIFKRGDRVIEEMVKRGEIKLSDVGYTATLVNCTPTAG